MKTYIGTKIIKAKPMTSGEYDTLRGWNPPLSENGDDAGYLVEYTDGGQSNHPDFKGYISWSPADVFERAYRETEGLTFGQALEALKQGLNVARKGWNGKGLKVFLHRPLGEINLPFLALAYPENPFSYYRNGAIVPWFASQTDMLEEDWYVVEGEE